MKFLKSRTFSVVNAQVLRGHWRRLRKFLTLFLSLTKDFFVLCNKHHPWLEQWTWPLSSLLAALPTTPPIHWKSLKRDATRNTRDLRQETCDRRRETGDVRQTTWYRIHETGDMIQETWYKIHDTRDIIQETVAILSVINHITFWHTKNLVTETFVIDHK